MTKKGCGCGETAIANDGRVEWWRQWYSTKFSYMIEIGSNSENTVSNDSDPAIATDGMESTTTITP